ILASGDKAASGPNSSFDYTVPGRGAQTYFLAISASGDGSTNGIPTDQKTGTYSVTLVDRGALPDLAAVDPLLPFGKDATYKNGANRGTYVTQDFGRGYIDPTYDHGATRTMVDQDLYYSLDFALDIGVSVLSQGNGTIISTGDGIPDGQSGNHG